MKHGDTNHGSSDPRTVGIEIQNLSRYKHKINVMRNDMNGSTSEHDQSTYFVKLDVVT